jgi:hypothetical protein
MRVAQRLALLVSDYRGPLAVGHLWAICADNLGQRRTQPSVREPLLLLSFPLLTRLLGRGRFRAVRSSHVRVRSSTLLTSTTTGDRYGVDRNAPTVDLGGAGLFVGSLHRDSVPCGESVKTYRATIHGLLLRGSIIATGSTLAPKDRSS